MSESDIDTDDANPAVTLGLLSAVASNSEVTQRTIATQLGIALGLTNAYLKRCVRKGYIKVSQIPSRRYAYYLTPRGFAEKSRLTAEYFSQSFLFFREAKVQCAEIFETCARRGWNRVVLLGAGDLCDIARLCAHETSTRIVGILDTTGATSSVAGIAVVTDPANLPPFDAAVVTELRAPQAMFDLGTKYAAADRIFVPLFLKLALGATVARS